MTQHNATHSEPGRSGGIARPISRRLRREVELLRDGLRPVIHWRPPEQRFLIFAQGRSGSTLLVSLLDCHPDIICDDEILNGKRFRRMRSPYLRAATRSRIARARGKRVYGFHAKIYQLTRDHGLADPGAFVRRLHRDGWKIIYLRRRNVMRQALSNQIANRRGYSSVSATEADKLEKAEPVAVDVDAVIRGIASREAFQRDEARVLDGIEHIEIEYERDLQRESSQQETADRVFRALGLEPVPVRAGLARIGRNRIDEYIANHEELRDALARNGYLHYYDSAET